MNMKKFIFFLFLLICCLETVAQEKLYKEAITQGPQANGAYLLQNKKLKTITYRECRDFLASKGYYVGNYEIEEVNRYGDHLYLIKTMEFIPKKDYDEYVFLNLNDEKIDFSQLKKGSLFIRTIVGNVFYQETKYNRLNDVLWSGDVKDGVLEGKGIGLIKQGGTYEYIKGTFSHGFPTTQIIGKKISISQEDGNIEESKLSSISYKEVKEEDLLFDYMSKRTDAYVKKELGQYFIRDYQRKTKLLETAYQQAKSLNISNYQDFKKDGIVEEFINLYEKIFNYDPQSLLPKAHELAGVYYVVDALNMKFRDHYYYSGFRTFLSGYLSWDDYGEKKDKELLDNGAKKASEIGKSSRLGLSQFGSQAYEMLNKKMSDLLDKIYSDAVAFDDYNARQKNINKAEDAKNSKLIDFNRSKEPSGDLIEVNNFFSFWYEYENEGNDIIFDYSSEEDNNSINLSDSNENKEIYENKEIEENKENYEKKKK